MKSNIEIIRRDVAVTMARIEDARDNHEQIKDMMGKSEIKLYQLEEFLKQLHKLADETP